ncbi:MAG: YraN family protein [Nocardioidaceae bacterium]
MTTTHAQRKALGDFGERLAARHLVERGLVIVDRNWRCRDGEIDIVARDGDVLVICEVKTRTSIRYGTPFEAITADKAARLSRLGYSWLRAHQISCARVRVDVISIVRPFRGAATVEHVEGLG